jgi:hypothetical protein
MFHCDVCLQAQSLTPPVQQKNYRAVFAPTLTTPRDPASTPMVRIHRCTAAHRLCATSPLRTHAVKATAALMVGAFAKAECIFGHVRRLPAQWHPVRVKIFLRMRFQSSLCGPPQSNISRPLYLIFTRFSRNNHLCLHAPYLSLCDFSKAVRCRRPDAATPRPVLREKADASRRKKTANSAKKIPSIVFKTRKIRRASNSEASTNARKAMPTRPKKTRRRQQRTPLPPLRVVLPAMALAGSNYLTIFFVTSFRTQKSVEISQLKTNSTQTRRNHDRN